MAKEMGVLKDNIGRLSSQTFGFWVEIEICTLYDTDWSYLNRAHEITADNARHFETLGGNKVENPNFDSTAPTGGAINDVKSKFDADVDKMVKKTELQDRINRLFFNRLVSQSMWPIIFEQAVCRKHQETWCLW